MKLIGNLREIVEKAQTKEEARNTIRKAGMLLTDEELEQIAGGEIVSRVPCDVCRSQKGDPACKECYYYNE